MAVAVGDIWQTQVEFRRDVESASIVRAYKVIDVTNPDEVAFGEGIVAQLLDRWETNWLPLMGFNASIICATARRVPPGAETRTFVDFSTAGAGTGVLAATSAQNSLLVSLYSEAGDIPKSGRAYIPFISKDSILTGQIQSISLPGIQTAIDAIYLVKMIIAAVGELEAAIARPDTFGLPWIAELIKSLVVRPVLASQRRRVVHHQTTI